MPRANDAAIELARNNLARLTKKPLVIVFAVVAVAVITGLAIVYRFSPKSSRTDCSFRIDESAVLPRTQGDAFSAATCVNLEVASTNSTRTLGLSGRPSMAMNQGMLFDFRQPGEYCIWMKDMKFALDIIWLSEEKEISQMIDNLTPDTYPKSYCGPPTSRYVVEVNSGVIKAADLHTGQRIKL